MNHDSLENLISAMLDGELDSVELCRAQHALATNPAARRILAEFQAIRNVVADLPAIACPQNAFDSFWTKVDENFVSDENFRTSQFMQRLLTEPEDLIDEYYDGQLTKEQCAAVEEQLLSRREYRASLDQTSLVSFLLEDLPTVKIPDGLTASAMQKIREDVQRSRDLSSSSVFTHAPSEETVSSLSYDQHEPHAIDAKAFTWVYRGTGLLLLAGAVVFLQGVIEFAGERSRLYVEREGQRRLSAIRTQGAIDRFIRERNNSMPIGIGLQKDTYANQSEAIPKAAAEFKWPFHIFPTQTERKKRVPLLGEDPDVESPFGSESVALTQFIDSEKKDGGRSLDKKQITLVCQDIGRMVDKINKVLADRKISVARNPNAKQGGQNQDLNDSDLYILELVAPPELLKEIFGEIDSRSIGLLTDIGISEQRSFVKDGLDAENANVVRSMKSNFTFINDSHAIVYPVKELIESVHAAEKAAKEQESMESIDPPPPSLDDKPTKIANPKLTNAKKSVPIVPAKSVDAPKDPVPQKVRVLFVLESNRAPKSSKRK